MSAFVSETSLIARHGHVQERIPSNAPQMHDTVAARRIVFVAANSIENGATVPQQQTAHTAIEVQRPLMRVEPMIGDVQMLRDRSLRHHQINASPNANHREAPMIERTDRRQQ